MAEGLRAKYQPEKNIQSQDPMCTSTRSACKLASISIVQSNYGQHPINFSNADTKTFAPQLQQKNEFLERHDSRIQLNLAMVRAFSNSSTFNLSLSDSTVLARSGPSGWAGMSRLRVEICYINCRRALTSDDRVNILLATAIREEHGVQ